MTKQVRVGDGFPTSKKKPRCPIHSDTMTLNLDENQWECLAENCRIIALPKEGDGGRVIKIDCAWKVATIRTPGADRDRFTLVNPSSNTSIDITDVVQTVDIQNSLSTPTTTLNSSANTTLSGPSVIEITLRLYG